MSNNLVSIDFYPQSILKEDKSPDFGIEIDEKCQAINAAMKGWGANHNQLIEFMGGTLCDERHKISLRYKELFNEDLLDRIHKECSGDYGLAMEFLACSPAISECYMLKKSFKGAGCIEEVAYSILCGRSNEEIDFLKKTYYKTFTGDLSKLVGNELRGDFGRIASACLQGAEEPFDPHYHTLEKAKEDAESLWKAGQGRWFGNDEKAMIKIVVMSPPKYLKIVNDAYAEKYGYTLFKAFEKELSGNAEEAALYTLGMKLKPYETVAKLIKKACAGLGTNELLLTSTLIRFQDVLGQVNLAHMDLFGKTIHERIRHECSGKYKTLLMTVVNKVCPEQ